jgi:hypothetical protein
MCYVPLIADGFNRQIVDWSNRQKKPVNQPFTPNEIVLNTIGGEDFGLKIDPNEKKIAKGAGGQYGWANF